VLDDLRRLVGDVLGGSVTERELKLADRLLSESRRERDELAVQVQKLEQQIVELEQGLARKDARINELESASRLARERDEASRDEFHVRGVIVRRGADRRFVHAAFCPNCPGRQLSAGILEWFTCSGCKTTFDLLVDDLPKAISEAELLAKSGAAPARIR
jgi:hypothetical protein